LASHVSSSLTMLLGGDALVNVIVFACVCGALFCLACVIGSLCASRQYKEEYKKKAGGCCSTGCCSVYASSGWALNTDCAAIFMLGGGFLLYTAMTGVQANMICIIDKRFELRDTNSEIIQPALSVFDMIFSLIDPVRPYLNLLNIFVAIPAALTALFMLLQSMCAYGAYNEHKSGKSWCSCCSKLFLLITFVWIILSFIVGVIAAALGPVVQLPFAQSILAPINGICETTLPILASNSTASSSTDRENFGNLCVCVTSFFGSAVSLFGPGICNIIVAIFAFYASCCQCWTEGCCVGPKTAKTSYVTPCGWLFCLCGGCCWGRRAKNGSSKRDAVAV
jgi:hypothetical protein